MIQGQVGATCGYCHHGKHLARFGLSHGQVVRIVISDSDVVEMPGSDIGMDGDDWHFVDCPNHGNLMVASSEIRAALGRGQRGLQVTTRMPPIVRKFFKPRTSPKPTA